MGSLVILSPSVLLGVLLALSTFWTYPVSVDATSKQNGITRHYTFNVTLKNVTRLCRTKTIVTVNGKFPGPRIVVREGDRLIVKVNNFSPKNISIHWHGIRQLRSGWADGPSYVTQCPIQTNQSYVYNFTIIGQRGTLFWHAHFSWMRATVYGPLIILPKHNESYPFAKPYKEVPIMLGEWFNGDTEAIINQSLITGGGPNVSDAYTVNGLPGPLYNCSAKDTFKLKVKPGKTYLLRIINAALNDEHFFSIANHSLTVVEADAGYVKHFRTSVLILAPGQTTNVLLKTLSSAAAAAANYYILARPYFTGMGTFDNTTVAAILEYEPSPHSVNQKARALLKPSLPAINATAIVANISALFRSLNTAEFPATVPQTVVRNFFFTVGLSSNPCPKNQTCQGPNGTKFAASINSISMTLPSVSLLQAYYSGMNGIYTTDFPALPLHPFNYTGASSNNTFVMNGTKLVVLPFNASVEVVLQGTSILGVESHPLHLHGYNFYVVGQGFGNFDPINDPKKYNLIDPVERNTVGVPSGGWVAIRFRADNPGVWLMHCHFDVHLSWGLRMAWIVKDGLLPNQKLLPPPSDLPKC